MTARRFRFIAATVLVLGLLFAARDEVFRTEDLVLEEPLALEPYPPTEEPAGGFTPPFELTRKSSLRLRLTHDGDGWVGVVATLVGPTIEAEETLFRTELGKREADLLLEDIPPGTYRLHLAPHWEPRLPITIGPPQPLDHEVSPPEATLFVYDGAQKPWRFALAVALLLAPLLLLASTGRDE